MASGTLHMVLKPSSSCRSNKVIQPFDSSFQYLFNSYYQTLGHPYPRIRRGVLSRPTVEAIYRYRQYVDEHMVDYLNGLSESALRFA